MREMKKKIIVSLLMAGLMQGGLLSAPIESAPRNDQEQDQERQNKQRQDKHHQDQQRQDKQRQESQRQEQQRHNWSHRAYRDNVWHRMEFSYNEPSPFRWYESRQFLNDRFSKPEYRMEFIRDHDWNRRFPGLHSYRWHDQHGYHHGYFWYRGMRIHDAVLFFNDWDELVGIGFMHNGVFVFIRDDYTVHEHEHDSALRALLLLIFAL